MAISFVGSAEGSAANGGDVTLTLPSMLENDLVIVAYAIGDNDNLDFNMAMVTAGYTEVADLFANDVQDCNLGVFWKKMGATPDTSAVVDGLGGTDAAVAAVAMVFRGVDTTTPMDVTPTTATAINTMHPNPPSIDHNNPAGVWTVIAGASGHILAGAGTYTFPTGYTTDALDRGQDDTSDVTVGMGYRTNPADPEDPGIMTHSGTDSADFAWCAATLALRPVSVQTFFITLAAVAVGVAVLTKVATFLKTMEATAVGVATMTKALVFGITLAAVATGVATLSKIPTFVKTLAATAIGVATMTQIATYARTSAATAVGVATLTRKQFQTMAATALGVATMTNVLTLKQTLAAVVVGLATLTKQFIAGGGVWRWAHRWWIWR